MMMEVNMTNMMMKSNATDISRKFEKRQGWVRVWGRGWGAWGSNNRIQLYMERKDRTVHETTGCKLGKEYVKAVYCHPAYLTSMQSTS